MSSSSSSSSSPEPFSDHEEEDEEYELQKEYLDIYYRLRDLLSELTESTYDLRRDSARSRAQYYEELADRIDDAIVDLEEIIYRIENNHSITTIDISGGKELLRESRRRSYH